MTYIIIVNFEKRAAQENKLTHFYLNYYLSFLHDPIDLTRLELMKGLFELCNFINVNEYDKIKEVVNFNRF